MKKVKVDLCGNCKYFNNTDNYYIRSGFDYCSFWKLPYSKEENRHCHRQCYSFRLKTNQLSLF